MLLDDYSFAATLATELANTTPEVWQGPDHLGDLDALVDFADEFDRAAAAPSDPDGHFGLGELARAADDRRLRAAQSLRYVVRELIDAPVRERLVAGATTLTASAGALTLVPGSRSARWAVELAPGSGIDEALALICGVGVLGVVQALGEQRFRQCSAPTCVGAFIDSTRAGRRRYCMPGLCGNRVNVANHRARRAATVGGGRTVRE
ncbi:MULTISPECIES: CGNR zinc finger domain-containing protein [Pseudonocardia]|uniref:CGNR zinc finger domain-containing protein n=1 Tax=Pseudonocardia TaxID=1847 RepID=UPI000A288114|nr:MULTISPECIES: CGNR zinc finger domain-containing protein [Pseudonocardia]